MNLDGWSGVPMRKESLHHKVGVLNRHCEDAGRDPAEIKHTVLMPTMVTDDAAAAAHFMANRKLGEGTRGGSQELRHRPDRRDHRRGCRRDHDLGGIPTDDIEQYELVAEEVLSAFD